ncbi:aldehyde dehydrogenase family protein [Thalassococcus sp. S3]|uniref:aldehyde dehydrogenase family protein n=1 Tax=Thalassococcus sp. S3 TaxID=2017482 RepID=UPI0010246DCB|nr:aldehyde dehydrogenase family protein [Thalassococcus sp. S3]QBF33323.1 aldehyde dehydrogenase family protein [Thalassococcus sp. S3]
MDTTKFYINGAWTAPSDPAPLDVIDPSTGAACATISLGNARDVDKAVAAARSAFPSWSSTSKEERLAALERLLALYKEGQAEIAHAMTQEMGAPKDYATSAQFDAGLVHLEETIRVLSGFDFEQTRGKDRLFYDPVGVCALITPWNWPMNQVLLKVAPALAAGCTMVLKPSEIAPLSSMVLAGMIDKADIPAGVFNLVNGDETGVGSALTSHPDVDLISFTGSTRAGTLISKAAADGIKRVALELGGKGANVVFADAGEDAVRRGVLHCFDNTGQSCDAPTRMLVERNRYAQAVQEAQHVAETVAIGSAHEPGDHIGPLVSAAHWEKVQGLIQAGIDEGARLVAGGTGKPKGLETGFFARPTVFADVSNDMTIAQEEVFGPVLVMIPFDTEDEAILIANDTPYGLGNYVQTRDAEKATRVARALRSGMVSINGDYLGTDMPFGGFKQSGIGREGSIWGLEEYLEVKAVTGDGA